MIEDEARQKWCPMARMLDEDGKSVYNRWEMAESQTYKPINCIASNCACWVWDGVLMLEEGEKNVGHCGLIR